MRRLFCILVILSLALPLAAQSKDTALVPTIPAAEKNRAVAVALSLLMPGAGQLYNGQEGKAALHFGLFAGSVTWVALRDIGPTNADIRPMDWLSVICVGATYVWAAVDAAVGAGGARDSASLRNEKFSAEPAHLAVGTFHARGISGISLCYSF